jgi:heme/copper-type cytochrome/quinol oxidase subunit 2
MVDSLAIKSDNAYEIGMKIKNFLSKEINLFRISLASLALMLSVLLVGGATMQPAYAGRQCGKGKNKVVTKLDLGCNKAHKNPIIDMIFALVRFLSIGVGIVVIASVVYSGVMYSTSQGNPEKTGQAKSRIQTSIMALVFYLFIFAIVQFLVPGGLFG